MTRPRLDLPDDLARDIASIWADIDDTKHALGVYQLRLRAGIKHARMLGCSWRSIGEAIGISAQAAHEHYRRLD
jgi:hypothetical protein